MYGVPRYINRIFLLRGVGVREKHLAWKVNHDRQNFILFENQELAMKFPNEGLDKTSRCIFKNAFTKNNFAFAYLNFVLAENAWATWYPIKNKAWNYPSKNQQNLNYWLTTSFPDFFIWFLGNRKISLPIHLIFWKV